MTQKNKETRGDDDRAWLALRYIADEMPAAERDAFEQRLELDSALCEAVAEAVGLTDAVAAAPPLATPAYASPPERNSPERNSPAPNAPAWFHAAGWMAAGAAACLAVVLTVRPFHTGTAGRRPAAGVTAANSAGTSDRRDIVLAWFRLRDADREATPETSDIDNLADTTADDGRDATAAWSDSDANPEASVPGWLLAALSSAPSDRNPAKASEQD